MAKTDLTGLWMVPYADLMSTLVILFLALFAYSYGERRPEYEVAVSRMQEQLTESEKTKRRARQAKTVLEIKEELQRLALKDFGVRVTATNVRLLLPAPVLFEEGSAKLSSGAGRVLGPLAKLFVGTENPVLVAGHTDDRPIGRARWADNWELSAARAFSVCEYLGRRGLDPKRCLARGYGEHRPAAPNDTPEGRAKNRRIEISLIRALREEA